jgi:hypothetical protein
VEGRTGGPAAGVPQPAQKPCPSANGLPQFLQKPAIDASPDLSPDSFSSWPSASCQNRAGSCKRIMIFWPLKLFVEEYALVTSAARK